MAIYYEIRIAGVVPAGALRGFEQLAADQSTETVVRGPLPDQAALNGLLARLESSGIQLVGMRRQKYRLPGQESPAGSAGRPASPSHRVGPGD
jgi:hypothetical protein